MKIINEETEYYEMQKVCYIRQKNLILIKMRKMHFKYITKQETIVIMQENLASHSIYNLRDKIPKNYFIMVVHVIITSLSKLGKEFDGQLE